MTKIFLICLPILMNFINEFEINKKSQKSFRNKPIIKGIEVKGTVFVKSVKVKKIKTGNKHRFFVETELATNDKINLSQISVKGYFYDYDERKSFHSTVNYTGKNGIARHNIGYRKSRNIRFCVVSVQKRGIIYNQNLNNERCDKYNE